MFCKQCILATSSFIIKSKFIENITCYANCLRFSNVALNDNLKEWKKIKLQYTKKQLQFILDTLNHSNREEIQKHGVLENQLQAIESIKSQNVVIKSLDQFILLSKIEVPEFQNICSTIASKCKSKFKSSSCVSPAIKKNNIEKIKTAVGLRIRSDYVSWSYLELNGSECNILKWDCHNFSSLPLNTDFKEIIKMGIDTANAIPKADAYVLEKVSSKPFSKINVGMYKLIMRHQQILSSIITTLSANNCFKLTNEENENIDNNGALYAMQTTVVAKKFGLYLGQEIVSSKEVVESLLTKQNKNLENISSISFMDDTQNKYNTQNSFMKEELSKSLLIALTFFDLAILG